MLVHRSNIDKHETAFAVQILRDQLGKFVYPVHRLDKPTSGVLLFALNKNTANNLSGQFFNQGVSKTYIAIVRGYTDDHITINHPLKVIRDKIADRKARTVKPPQQALTSLKTIAKVELPYAVDKYPSSRYSLVELKPSTGRKHQLRRHLKHISHPIIGDPKYGKSSHNQFFAERYGARRLMLHAHKLQFTHPITNEKLLIQAGLDVNFKIVISVLFNKYNHFDV